MVMQKIQHQKPEVNYIIYNIDIKLSIAEQSVSPKTIETKLSILPQTTGKKNISLK